MPKKTEEGVYRIVDVVGVSETSWEDAGRQAVKTASKSLRDLRIAEVVKMDMKVEDGRSWRSVRAWRSHSSTKRNSPRNIPRILSLWPQREARDGSFCRRTTMKDLVAIAEKIASVLTERKQTIAIAESSTGGLISAALLAVPGASAYFLGGAVVYTRKSRGVAARHSGCCAGRVCGLRRSPTR